MSQGYPSLTALLGLIAIAGYQNRDKIMEMLGGDRQPDQAPPAQGAGPGTTGAGLGGLLSGLGGPAASANPGGFINSGLGELLERFQQGGQRETAQSWVDRGPNKEIAPNQLEQVIGPDILGTLTRHTGLSREELLSRLSRDLPQAVDRYTPDGRI